MPYQFWHSKLTAPPIHVPAIGLQLFVRIPHDTTDENISVIETINEPGFGPPLHRHPQTEIFRVLDGRYLYECDGKRFVAETGDVVTIPGGAAHAFRNLSDGPARQLVMILPSFDTVAFFNGLGDIMADGVPDRDVLNAFSEKWQIEFLGPPLQL